jgi:hypothetical protein
MSDTPKRTIQDYYAQKHNEPVAETKATKPKRIRKPRPRKPTK